MPRGIRPKPSYDSISEDILTEIKSFRPLRLFIAKEKKKGNKDKPFVLRVKHARLPKGKQDRFLQKAVNKYIELLDEQDIDEKVQVECKLFDYLLMKGEQAKYFQSINAPAKPPGNAVPFFTQTIKDEVDDGGSESSWKSLSQRQRRAFQRRRGEAKLEYAAQVRNFANDLPERLRTDYLVFAGQYPSTLQTSHASVHNGDGTRRDSQLIRQRRKSLTALPSSLQTSTSPSSTDEVPVKLTKTQMDTLHSCMPAVLYYEEGITDADKPTFTKTMTKNAYIKTAFAQLDNIERLKYVLKATEKWTEFLEDNPDIVEHLIPTLHLLLARNDEIMMYYASMGLPARPPFNGYLYFNQEKEETGSQQSWTELSATERAEYSRKLMAAKNDYYEKLVDFVENTLTSGYTRCELFCNVKCAVRDYELASKNEITDKRAEKITFYKHHLRKIDMRHRLNKIKKKLYATELTHEQKLLVEELCSVVM